MLSCTVPCPAHAAQKSGSQLGEIIGGALTSAERVSKDLYDGNVRLAEAGLNIVEKDLRLAGKHLPLERIYGLLMQADDSIREKTPARAKSALDAAAHEAKKLRGVKAETVASLQQSLKEGSAALGSGSVDAAKKSISAAHAVLDGTGARAHYKQAQAHLARARANVLDGAVDGAQSEVGLLKESLGELKGSVEASQVRGSIANAAAFVQKGGVEPAQREISRAIIGISQVSAKAGEAGKGALARAADDLKRVSAGLSAGASKTNTDASNSLNDILLSIEEFLE